MTEPQRRHEEGMPWTSLRHEHLLIDRRRVDLLREMQRSPEAPAYSTEDARNVDASHESSLLFTDPPAIGYTTSSTGTGISSELHPRAADSPRNRQEGLDSTEGAATYASTRID